MGHVKHVQFLMCIEVCKTFFQAGLVFSTMLKTNLTQNEFRWEVQTYRPGFSETYLKKLCFHHLFAILQNSILMLGSNEIFMVDQK